MDVINATLLDYNVLHIEKYNREYLTIEKPWDNLIILHQHPSILFSFVENIKKISHLNCPHIQIHL